MKSGMVQTISYEEYVDWTADAWLVPVVGCSREEAS
jgi:hypothetical protein